MASGGGGSVWLSRTRARIPTNKGKDPYARVVVGRATHGDDKEVRMGTRQVCGASFWRDSPGKSAPGQDAINCVLLQMSAVSDNHTGTPLPPLAPKLAAK